MSSRTLASQPKLVPPLDVLAVICGFPGVLDFFAFFSQLHVVCGWQTARCCHPHQDVDRCLSFRNGHGLSSARVPRFAASIRMQQFAITWARLAALSLSVHILAAAESCRVRFKCAEFRQSCKSFVGLRWRYSRRFACFHHFAPELVGYWCCSHNQERLTSR